ncbi:unnamed protein product, partial [Durusdinium trenchii]
AASSSDVVAMPSLPVLSGAADWQTDRDRDIPAQHAARDRPGRAASMRRSSWRRAREQARADIVGALAKLGEVDEEQVALILGGEDDFVDRNGIALPGAVARHLFDSARLGVAVFSLLRSATLVLGGLARIRAAVGSLGMYGGWEVAPRVRGVWDKALAAILSFVVAAIVATQWHSVMNTFGVLLSLASVIDKFFTQGVVVLWVASWLAGLKGALGPFDGINLVVFSSLLVMISFSGIAAFLQQQIPLKTQRQRRTWGAVIKFAGYVLTFVVPVLAAVAVRPSFTPKSLPPLFSIQDQLK